MSTAPVESHAPAPVTAPAPVVLDAPAFDKAMVKFSALWWDQPNDMKKTAVYDDARRFERTFFQSNTTVRNWTGYITHMATQDGGQDICLMISLGARGNGSATDKHVSLSQGCLGTALSPDPKGVKKGTAVYAQLAEFDELNPPNCVMFDGEIDPIEDHHDNEIEAMKTPSYAMRFNSLKVCSRRLRDERRIL